VFIKQKKEVKFMASTVPNSEATQFRTGKEQVEIARKGGIASGEARREKKLFRETIEKKLGANIDDIINAMITKASSGDVQATTFLRDTIGEKPTDKVEADIDSNVVINVEIDEE
jgi:hypothetical protein